MTTGNASELLQLTQFRRKHVIAALTHLSKFIGCYNNWRDIVKNYNLRWKEQQDFIPFEKPDINQMIEYIREIKHILPADMYNTFLFGILTGLRSSEICLAIALIQNDKEEYYNEKYGVLQHYKFQDLFFRQTKKAYISVVDDSMLELAKNAHSSYQAIRGVLRRNQKHCNMAYCRKIHGTFLRDNGIPTEIVDVLQGRVGVSLFAKHYYRPDFLQYADKIRPLLKSLLRLP